MLSSEGSARAQRHAGCRGLRGREGSGSLGIPWVLFRGPGRAFYSPAAQGLFPPRACCVHPTGQISFSGRVMENQKERNLETMERGFVLWWGAGAVLRTSLGAELLCEDGGGREK